MNNNELTIIIIERILVLFVSVEKSDSIFSGFKFELSIVLVCILLMTIQR